MSPGNDGRASHSAVADIVEAQARRDVVDDEELYRRLAPDLIRFATSLVGRDDAQDVLSAAVVRSLSSPQWPTVANRRAYLYRAVLSEACSSRRRASLRRDRERGLAADRPFELPTIRPDVRAAVVALSVRQRAVVVLAYWADLDPASIASTLGISEGSVRRHLARARSHLRKVLDA